MRTLKRPVFVHTLLCIRQTVDTKYLDRTIRASRELLLLHAFDINLYVVMQSYQSH